MIVYLQRNKIDIKKWDQAIDQAANGLVYAYSWYLDIVCNGDWDALVDEDYNWVMPLPWRKRFGIKYIYQPFCTPQLGVFGKSLPNDSCVQQFQDAIPNSFKLIDQKVNRAHASHLVAFKSEHNSYYLDLRGTYEEIQKGYNTHTGRSLRKAKKQVLDIRSDISPKEVLFLFKNNKGLELKDISDHDYSLLLSVLEKSATELECSSLGVFNDRNECIAAACFVFSHQNIYFLLSAVNEEGKEKRAMYFLLDQFFSQHHSKGLIFDFEGSDIPGLARFYSGFGAVPKSYKRIYQNKLPAIIKWFK